jgi:hypothetical protein
MDGIIGKIHRREPLVLWERVVVSNSAYIPQLLLVVICRTLYIVGTRAPDLREGYQVHTSPDILYGVRSESCDFHTVSSRTSNAQRKLMYDIIFR